MPRNKFYVVLDEDTFNVETDENILFTCDEPEEAKLLAKAFNEGASNYDEACEMYPDLNRWRPEEHEPQVMNLDNSNMEGLWRRLCELGGRYIVYLSYSKASGHMVRILDGYDVKEVVRGVSDTAEGAMRDALILYSNWWDNNKELHDDTN